MKLYADEDRSSAVESLGFLVISCLARVEVPAAFWRKHRAREFPMTHAALLTAEFEEDYYGSGTEPSRFAVVALAGEVLDRAARMSATHRLRAYDAVQLATATAARDVDPGCEAFACFDDDLRAAAAAERFALVPT